MAITERQYEEICKRYFDDTSRYNCVVAGNCCDIVVFNTDDEQAYVYTTWADCFFYSRIEDNIISDIYDIGLNDTIEWLGAKNFIDIYRTYSRLYIDMNIELEDANEIHYVDYLENYFNHNNDCPMIFNEWLKEN